MNKRLREKVIRAGINYVNALDGKQTSPFTPKEFLTCLEIRLKRLRDVMFDGQVDTEFKQDQDVIDAAFKWREDHADGEYWLNKTIEAHRDFKGGGE